MLPRGSQAARAAAYRREKTYAPPEKRAAVEAAARGADGPGQDRRPDVTVHRSEHRSCVRFWQQALRSPYCESSVGADSEAVVWAGRLLLRRAPKGSSHFVSVNGSAERSGQCVTHPLPPDFLSLAFFTGAEAGLGFCGGGALG